MKTYKTTEGIGWRDVPPIQSFISAYNSIRDEAYEIKCCLRTRSLQEMRDALQDAVNRMNEALSEIGDKDKIVEKKN